MGNLLISEDSNKQNYYITELLSQYKIIQLDSTYEVTVFDNIYNPNLLIEMRKFNFATQETLTKKLKELERAKTINHPTILKIYGTQLLSLSFQALHSQKLETFCSSSFQLTVINEHPQNTLTAYLERRGPKDFPELDLWYFLDCIVSAQSHIQNLQREPRSLSFDDIFICTTQNPNESSQIWKIALKELDFITPNNMPLMEKVRYNQSISNANDCYYHLYPSPEEINEVSGQQLDPYKCSLFTLGMLLLHLSQGEACDSLYQLNLNNSLFDVKILENRLYELKTRFSSSFCDIIRTMLIIDPQSRLDYNGLNEKLNLVPELKDKRAQIKLNQAFSTSNSQIQLKSQIPFRTELPPFPSKLSGNFQQLASPNFNSKSSSKQDLAVVTESYQNGSQYTGDKVNGLRHGRGRMLFCNGQYYEGNWRDNEMDGKGREFIDQQKGILFSEKNEKIFDGEFRRGKFHNFGHLFNTQAIKLNEPFDYQNFKVLGHYWLTYDGDFLENKQHGFGVLKLTNGEKYTGSFMNNFLHGNGAFTRMDGQTLNGYWEYNLLIRVI